MLAGLLGDGGQAQHFVGRGAAPDMHIAQFQASFGDGAGFVKGERGDFR